MKKRIYIFLLMAAALLALLPFSISAACDHSFGGFKWCDGAHPHEYFYFCQNGCEEKQYLGEYATKSNCAICNTSLTSCSHEITWTDEVHPHEIVCKQCCKSLGYTTMSGCSSCCTNHYGYYYTESYHNSGGYHEEYLYCYNCGNYIYQGRVYNYASCDICNPPKVSSISLSASGPHTSLSASGIIEATDIPASFTVYASCENCRVKEMYYFHNGDYVSTSSSSISFTAYDYPDFGSITVYAIADTGVTDSITVNFTFARYAEAAVKWEYAGAVIREISLNGSTIRSGLSESIDLDWLGADLSESDYNTITGLVGAYDGQTYILSGSSRIRVYRPSTGQTLGIYDTYSEYDSLCDLVSWTPQTLSAFRSCQSISLSYQAPKAVEGTAVWQTSDGTVLYQQSASSVSGHSYIKPNQSISVVYSASSYAPSGYKYKGMSWSCGSDVGTSPERSSYSCLYNYTTSPVDVTFIYDIIPTSGNITVAAYDGDTMELVTSATTVCGTTSGGNPNVYANLPFGTYDISASADRYAPAAGTVTITADSADRVVDLMLLRNSGDVTVYVYDSETNLPISGASISGAASGTTDSNGSCSFSGISFMGTHTFSASADGYYSNSGSVSLSRTKLSDTITIYLDPIPKTGDITVTVYDSETSAPISSASVTGAGTSDTTDTSGSITFADILFGSYTFTASASGYYDNSGTASISLADRSGSVNIYLTPIPTSGDITVYVVDYDTGAVISGADVSDSEHSGMTDSYGSITFYDLEFGSYTFTASCLGYYSDSGTASISVDYTYDSVTIYLEKIKTDLSINSAVNGTVYQGSTIIVSAKVLNDGDIDLTPSLAARVNMTATVNGTIFASQTKSVICPAYRDNLVWFTVTIPNSADSVKFNFDVSAPHGVTELSLDNNTDSITVPVYVLPNRKCADAGLELTAPSGFRYSSFNTRSSSALTWNVWEWNGGFVYRSYGAKLITSAVLKPDASAVWQKYDTASGKYVTRSGYGLNTELTAVVDSNTSNIAGILKVDAFYPEYNYSTENTKSDRLEKFGNGYVFKPLSSSVSGARMHAAPVWFPDKAYSVKYYVYDVWCPAGMLTAYDYADVMIEGSMYDDYYTGH